MKIYPIGTTGKAARDLECMLGTIKKGSAVTITGIDTIQPSRGYELTNQSGFCIAEKRMFKYLFS